MTVSSQTNNETFHGNSVTTIWDLPFRFFNNADISAYRIDPITQVATLLVQGTDYTLFGAGLPEQFGASPGKITTTVPIATGKDLYVERIMEVEQLTDIVNQARFFPEVHEDVFDRLTMLIQQSNALLGRGLALPSGLDYYDAQMRQIKNLADPTDNQDAATLKWATDFIASILATGQGPVNNAANVIYTKPGGAIDVVQGISSPTGTSYVGDGAGSLSDTLALINAQIVSIVKRSTGYLSVTPSANAITINASDASTFGINVTQAINVVTLTGAVAGQKFGLDLVFTQGGGGFPVSLPSSVKPPVGGSVSISSAPYSVTFLRMVTVDGGVTWIANSSVVYSAFPAIADMNSTFNSEGDSTAPFTASNATMAVTSGYLRSTKVTGGVLASIGAPVTFTPTNADFILYGKVRARNDANSIATIRFLNGSKEVSMWFGTAAANTAATPGAISIAGVTGASTRNVASAGTGYSYDTVPVDFALQFDKKFSSLTCWIKQVDGTWDMAARVACDWMSAANIEILTTTASTAGAWIEFDYLTLCRPNIVMISDSIGEGKTLFSPDLTLGLTNFQSTWMAHAPIPAYLGQRNNLIVNKGVGGQSSATIAARAAVDCAGARVVFLHASSNDLAAGVSQDTRKTNIQNTVNAIAGVGGATVLLNAGYGTQAVADNTPLPVHRDYMKLSWDTYLPTVNGVSAFVDIMTPVLDGNGFLSASYSVDGIHLNIAGHTAVGAYIASST